MVLLYSTHSVWIFIHFSAEIIMFDNGELSQKPKMSHTTFLKSENFWSLKPTHLVPGVSDKGLWTVSYLFLTKLNWGIHQNPRNTRAELSRASLVLRGSEKPHTFPVRRTSLPSLKLTNSPKLVQRRNKLLKGQVWEAQRTTPRCFPQRESSGNMGSRNKCSPLTMGLLWRLIRTRT